MVAGPWDTIQPGREEGVVCLRSTWDYHLRWSEFRSWVRGFEDAGAALEPAGDGALERRQALPA